MIKEEESKEHAALVKQSTSKSRGREAKGEPSISDTDWGMLKPSSGIKFSTSTDQNHWLPKALKLKDGSTVSSKAYNKNNDGPTINKIIKVGQEQKINSKLKLFLNCWIFFIKVKKRS